jgi:hypothetical protein
MPFEFIVGAVVGGAAVSQRIRKAVRKGLIYGVGGALVAFDKVAAMAHGVRQGVHKATASTEKATATVPVSPTAAPATGAAPSEAAPQVVTVNASSPVGTPS